MPKISLVLTLYNAEKYLIPCLQSVKNQTFTDFECLCVNDGSSDKTQDIIDEYAAEDARFVPIIQDNAGCSEARNAGIKASKAPYIMLLDQDDFFHPQAMETLLYLIETYNTDVAGFAFKSIDDSFDVSTAPHYDIANLTTETTNTAFDDFLSAPKKHSVVVWTRIYNKQAIEGLLFPKDVQPAEDTTFTLKVLHRIHSMVSIKEPLLFYRDGNDTSVMAQHITERYIKAHIGAAKAITTHFEDKQLSPIHAERLNAFIAVMVYKTCISQVLRWTKDAQDRERFVNVSYPMVKTLYDEKIFDMSALKLRHRIVTKLFLLRHYTLARLFL